VVVCADRWRAGSHALERLQPPPDLFLLDDGFSHLRLRRDLDLLVFPSADPFAGGRLLPGGRLREPLSAATRADAVLLSGAELDDGDGDRLARALRPHGFAGPGFVVRSEIGTPQPVPPASSARPPAGPFLVVSAIARPQSFLETVHRAGLEIAGELAFRDHHAYPPASLEKIRREMAARGARALAVTSKDRVKLQGRLDLPMVEVPLRAVPEPAFWRWLDDRLRGLET
jgi:tetraacyldisaccharide 4'-kinase